MSRHLGIFLALAVTGCSTQNHLSSAGSSGKATQFEPGSGPYAYECDALPGKYNLVNAHPPGQSLKVTGQFQFLDPRYDQTWVPTATVGLVDDPGVGVSLYALVSRGSPTRIMFFIEGVRGQGRQNFAQMPLGNYPIPFTVTLDGSGKLSVSVSQVTKTISVTHFDLSRVMLSCASAHVRFSDVTVLELR